MNRDATLFRCGSREVSCIKKDQTASGFRWYLFTEAKEELIEAIKEGLWEAKMELAPKNPGDTAIIFNWDPFVSHLVRIRIEGPEEAVKSADKTLEHIIHKKCMYNGVKLISGDLKTVTS
jgi:hypothetical protein